MWIAKSFEHLGNYISKKTRVKKDATGCFLDPSVAIAFYLSCLILSLPLALLSAISVYFSTAHWLLNKIHNIDFGGVCTLIQVEVSVSSWIITDMLTQKTAAVRGWDMKLILGPGIGTGEGRCSSWSVCALVLYPTSMWKGTRFVDVHRWKRMAKTKRIQKNLTNSY